MNRGSKIIIDMVNTIVIVIFVNPVREFSCAKRVQRVETLKSREVLKRIWKYC